ncbi:MAG: hypothetical protein PHE83_14870, partial [Opitutaceae bacterium]|nr:hypothetical protein [Opitutaceae bacterium]
MRLPILIRLRTSFGGRLSRDGSLVRYTREDVARGRKDALLAEEYLYHPARLPLLQDATDDLKQVREYIEQEMDINLALTDPASFRWLMNGVTQFCLLGFQGEGGNAP